MRISNAIGAALRCGFVALALFAGSAARADDKLVVLTTWYAQAEHGGFYQAARHRHLQEVRPRRHRSRWAARRSTACSCCSPARPTSSWATTSQVLQGVEHGLPLVTVAAPFQYDLQGVITHDDVKSLADLKDKTILVAGTGTHLLVAVAEGQVRLHRRADAALHLQPAAVLCRPEHRAAGLRLVRAVPGRAEGRREGELLPARRRRLSALHAGHRRRRRRPSPRRPEMVARFVKATRSKAGRAIWRTRRPAIARSRRTTRT